MARPRKYPIETIVQMYQSGMTMREIGIALGAGRNSVRNALRLRNIPVGPHKTGRPKGGEKWAEIERLNGLGYSNRRIGKALGMHQTSVLYVLRRLGLDTAPRPAIQPKQPRPPRLKLAKPPREKVAEPVTTKVVDISSPRIERMMAISLKIERRGRGMLA